MKAGLTKGTKMFPGLPTQADVECSGMLAGCGFRRLEACQTLADEALVEYIHQTGAAWPVCKDPHGVPDAAACFFAFEKAWCWAKSPKRSLPFSSEKASVDLLHVQSLHMQQIDAGLFRRKRQRPYRALCRVPGFVFYRRLLSPPLQMQEVPDRGSTSMSTPCERSQLGGLCMRRPRPWRSRS